MEKLRTRLAYSIVADLRSTALRRVAHTSHAHLRRLRQASSSLQGIDCQTKANHDEPLMPRAQKSSEIGVDKLFHSNAGFVTLISYLFPGCLLRASASKHHAAARGWSRHRPISGPPGRTE